MAKEFFLKPTDTELEILNILWQKKQATVREVHDKIAATKEIGYTTTLKLMQIMFEKGMLKRERFSKQHIYTPTLKQAVAQKHIMDRMLQTLFNGSTADLVLQVLGNNAASNTELKEIEAFLKTKM